MNPSTPGAGPGGYGHDGSQQEIHASDRSTQLSAIVFTDIAGYSRLMEEDEERTIGLLKEHNRIVLPLIERAGGEVIDAIGDGLFILFPSVREAVVCSVAIQEALGAYNEQASHELRFLLRIGVHLGEVWRDGDRVFGNGVNVAARVQPLAAPGGICITEDVYRQVSNKLSHEIRSLGERELKNISRKMELYQVVTGREERGEVYEGGPGELDAIKQRILGERERIARMHASGAEGETSATSGERSFEHRIESKVFSLVERVMDTAINKWDAMPEDKKSRAVARIQEEIEKEIEKETGKSSRAHHVSGEISTGHHEKEKGDGSDLGSKLGTGLVFGTGFGLGYFAFGIGWMIWPFAILGVLPFGAGVIKALKMFARSERRKRERPVEIERRLLATARTTGGTLTVVQAASLTDIPLDEVQQGLDRMTAKGYVQQNVRESGVIEYEFPSLAEQPAGGQ